MDLDAVFRIIGLKTDFLRIYGYGFHSSVYGVDVGSCLPGRYPDLVFLGIGWFVINFGNKTMHRKVFQQWDLCPNFFYGIYLTSRICTQKKKK
jgi:hypothetical protein